MDTPSEQRAGRHARPSADTARQLHKEQLLLFYRQAAPALLASVIVALFTAFILQDQVPGQNIAIWLAVTFPLYGVRFVLIRRLRGRTSTAAQRRQGAMLLTAGIFISGLVWGWGTLFLYPEHSVIHQVFLVLVAAGLSSGSTVTYAALRWAGAAFIAPAMAPLGIKFLTVGEPIYISMGLIILVYTALLLTAHDNAYQVIRNGILAGLEKAALAEDLQREVEERRLTEQSLLASRKKLTDAQRIAGFGNWEWDILAGTVAWSSETGRIFGLERNGAPLTRDDYIGLIHPDDRTAVLEAFDASLRAGAPFSMDYRIVRPGGEVRHVHDEGEVRRDEEGAAVAMAGVVQDITRRVQAEQRIKQSEREFSRILNNIQDIYYRTDLDSVITRISPSVSALLGYSPSECMGRSLSRLLAHPVQAIRLQESVRSGGGAVTNFEAKLRRRDGSEAWFSFNAQYVRDEAGGIVAFEGVARDITQIKRAEEALFHEKERALVTLESIGDGVITTDRDGTVEYVNPVAEKLLDQEADALYGRCYVDVLHLVDDAGEPLGDLVSSCMAHDEGVVHADDKVIRHRNGTEYSIKISAAAMHDSAGELVGAVLVLHDMTDLARMARQLSYQATHDMLTGLVNRREFEKRVERAIGTARSERRVHAVLYLDLDRFKLVNDTCGHRAGDLLLEQLATLMGKRIRERDTLARLGGDEFGLLLEDCAIADAGAIAEDVRRILREFRFVWGEKIFDVGVSIGVAPVDGSSASLVDVLGQADAACYVAKDLGRNRVHLYTPGDHAVGRHHGETEWVHRMYSAFDEDRFLLFAQPIVGLGPEGEVSHYEILMRMEAEDGSIIAPDAFIPAAERYNLMPTLDRWVVRTSLGILRQAQGPLPQPPVRCAINLSGQSLCDDHFLDFVIEQLDFTGVPGEAICFEITETAAVANLSKAMRFISILKGMGCSFALDDFGTGLSSFGYLKNLSVDYLKIDGSFVRDIVSDPVDRAMVASINEIGHVMGLKTIAEFVEKPGVIEQLRLLEVDLGQGHELGRPVPFMALLKEHASIANVVPHLHS